MHHFKILSLFLLFTTIGNTATITLNSSGWWNDPLTWPNGTFPTTADDIIIPEGIVLTMLGDCVAKSITVNGTLRGLNHQAGGTWIRLSTERLIVSGPNALLEIGTEAQPYHADDKCIITLTGTVPSNPTELDRSIMAMNGGTIELHGKQRLSWTNLAQTAEIGSNQIILQDPVNWEPGDIIAITSTALAKNSEKSWENVDEVQVQSISPDRKVIALTSPLLFKHIGAVRTYSRSTDQKSWEVNISAEVGLLSHYIKIQGEMTPEAESSGFGGHIMLMKGSTAHVEHVELYKMGQKSITGRYPFHWHLNEDQAQGSYLRNSSIHRSFNRAVTIHGTDYVTVDGVFAYDHIGHGIFFEDGSERFDTIRNTVVFVTRRPEEGEEITPSDNEFNQLQNRTPSSYWITNPNNYFENVVAAGTEGTGFWFAMPESPMAASADIEYYDGIEPHKEPLGLFENFVVHTCMNGFDLFDRLNPDHSIKSNWGWIVEEDQYLRNGMFYGNDQAIYCGLDVQAIPELVIFENCVFSDNQTVTMLAANLTISNSLFNADSDFGVFEGIRDFYRFYDGPGRHLKCHFEGWDRSYANMIKQIIGGGATPNINASFAGTTKGFNEPFKFSFVDIPPNTRGMTVNQFFKDYDGGLLGKANTTLVRDIDFNTDGHEYKEDSWYNAVRSDYFFTTIWLHKLQFDGLPLSIVRSKPGTDDVCFYEPGDTTGTYKFGLIANQGFRYTYFLTDLPSSNHIHVIMDRAEIGDKTYTIYKGLAKAANFSVSSSSGITILNSAEAVEAANNLSYFIDTNGDVHIKMVFSGPSRTTVDLKWDGSGDFIPISPPCTEDRTTVTLNTNDHLPCDGTSTTFALDLKNASNESQANYIWESSIDAKNWVIEDNAPNSITWEVPSSFLGEADKWWRVNRDVNGFSNYSNIIKTSVQKTPELALYDLNICSGEDAKLTVHGYDPQEGCFDLSDFFGEVDKRGSIGVPPNSSLEADRFLYSGGGFGTTYFDISVKDNNESGYLDYNYDFESQDWSNFNSVEIDYSFGGNPDFTLYILDENQGFTQLGQGNQGIYNLPSDLSAKDEIKQIKLRYFPADIGTAGMSKRVHLSTITICGNSFSWSSGETMTSMTVNPPAEMIYTASAKYGNCQTTVSSNVQPNFTCETNDSNCVRSDNQSENINIWIGNNNGNWKDAACNWSKGCYPTQCDDVIVENGQSIILSGNETITVNSITLKQGAEVKLQNGAKLVVRND